MFIKNLAIFCLVTQWALIGRAGARDLEAGTYAVSMVAAPLASPSEKPSVALKHTWPEMGMVEVVLGPQAGTIDASFKMKRKRAGAEPDEERELKLRLTKIGQDKRFTTYAGCYYFSDNDGDENAVSVVFTLHVPIDPNDDNIGGHVTNITRSGVPVAMARLAAQKVSK
jgi:hypothetical protein